MILTIEYMRLSQVLRSCFPLKLVETCKMCCLFCVALYRASHTESIVNVIK